MILKILLYFVVGFIEMFIVTQRTYWIAKGRSLLASGAVFIEVLIYFFVITEVLKGLNNSLIIIIPYALGSALGTYINLEKFPY